MMPTREQTEEWKENRDHQGSKASTKINKNDVVNINISHMKP